MDARETEARAASGCCGWTNAGARFDRHRQLERPVQPPPIRGKQNTRSNWRCHGCPAENARSRAASRLENRRQAALRPGSVVNRGEAWWALARYTRRQTAGVASLGNRLARWKPTSCGYRVGELSRIDANLAQTETHAANAEWSKRRQRYSRPSRLLQPYRFSCPRAWTKKPTTRRLIDETGDSAASHPFCWLLLPPPRSRASRWSTNHAVPCTLLGTVVSGRARSVATLPSPIPTPWASSSRFRSRPVRRSASDPRRLQKPRRIERIPTSLRIQTRSARSPSARSVRRLNRLNASSPWQERRQPRTCACREGLSPGESDLATLLRIRAAA